MTQRELAESTGRTQAAISLWEAGRRVPGLDDLIDLARALGTELGSFLPPDDVQQPIEVLLRGTVARIAGARLRGVVDELLENVVDEGVPDVRFRITSAQPSKAAEELLRVAAVTDAPVDLDAIAKGLGARVYFVDMPDGLSGLVFKVAGGAVVAINAHHHERRGRFSLAHELGHLVLDHLDRFHIDVQDSDVPDYDWRVERAANEFAAELLMPTDLVRARFTDESETAHLAKHFGVSELAMGYRLINLGLRH